jgi:glycosyltransferase involved in cell wall biosynthesis
MAGEVPGPVSRNSACPCGSGKRYKECHGAIASVSPPAAAAALPQSLPGIRSSYRAPSAEWAHLPESERDRCGALMEQALACQVAGRNDDAARAYRSVLLAAPRTHDALHMLGVVVLGQGDPDEAERLILTAMELRAHYPGIRANLELARESGARRDRAQTEELCERALSLQGDLCLFSPPAVSPRANAASATLHLIGPIHGGDQDDAWLFRFLAESLADAQPHLWATDHSSGARDAVTGARAIDVAAGWYPRGGIHLFAGVHFPEGDWLRHTQAERVIVFCTGAAPSDYLDQLRAIARDGLQAVELVFPAHSIAARFGKAAHVLPLPPPRAPANVVAGTTFGPRPRDGKNPERPERTLGVTASCGRRVREAEDADYLGRLALAAGQLALYDPGRLRFRLGRDPRVRFVPRLAGGLHAFLRSLDCYLYRPVRWWEEDAGGRVLPALACGLPVLVPRSSAFAEYVTDRIDGLLYADDGEALELVRELRESPELAVRIGDAAKRRSGRLFESDSIATAYRSLVFGSPDPHPAARAAIGIHQAS